MSRRKPPPIVQMGYSGVSEAELEELVEQLENNGAKNITVMEDENTMKDFPGKFYIVDYTK